MTTRVVLLDSGGANVGSVQAAFARFGLAAPVTSDRRRIRAATHVLLPGVGAAGVAMARLRENGLDRLIPTLSQPVLGICVGMQLLFERSEEGGTECLGLLAGDVRRMRGDEDIRVPHLGWNQLRPVAAHPLVKDMDNAWVYFVHSYAVAVAGNTLASCTHGDPFSAVVGKDRVFGAQFHPERSSAAGAQLLKNFLALT